MCKCCKLITFVVTRKWKCEKQHCTVILPLRINIRLGDKKKSFGLKIPKDLKNPQMN